MIVVVHPWTFESSPASGAGLDYSGNSDYGGGYTDLTAEADAITNILRQAQSERQSVVNAVNDALSCGSAINRDQQALATAQADRRQFAQDAVDTPVDSLDGASMVPQELSTALSDSATADGDFAQWVGDLENSCSSGSVTQDPNYAAANSASTQADQDKQSLLSTWNPIAQQYDQQTWSISDI